MKAAVRSHDFLDVRRWRCMHCVSDDRSMLARRPPRPAPCGTLLDAQGDAVSCAFSAYRGRCIGLFGRSSICIDHACAERHQP